MPIPSDWCEYCQADTADERNHYHCSACHGRTSIMGHLNGCPVDRPPLATASTVRIPAEDLSLLTEDEADVIDTRVQKVTTTVVRRSMKTPTNWNEVMKVTTIVMHELNAARGRSHDDTPSDDEMWFVPGPDDDEISICYELTKTEDVRE